MAVIGVRGRGTELAHEFAKRAGRRDRRALRHRRRHVRQAPQGHREVDGEGPANREGFPPAARRQVDRRHRDRHARPLACPTHGDGLPGGKGCLLREAGQPQRRRRPADDRGRAEVQARRPARHPAQEHAARSRRDRRSSTPAGSERSARPAPGFIRQRKPIGHGKPGEVPTGVDYAMWQGPAPTGRS